MKTEKENGVLPENRAEVDYERVDLFKKWVAEYVRQDSQDEPSYKTYLAFRAMRMSYENLNWREKSLIWAKPEETVLRVGFIETKGRGEVRPIYLRPVFEENLISLPQNMKVESSEETKSDYRLECKNRGLQIPVSMFGDAFSNP